MDSQINIGSTFTVYIPIDLPKSSESKPEEKEIINEILPDTKEKDSRKSILVLILGAVGRANMWAAVFADVGVSVIAILNAIRAMRVKQFETPAQE